MSPTYFRQRVFYSLGGSEAHFLSCRRNGEFDCIGELIAGVQFDAILSKRPTFIRP